MVEENRLLECHSEVVDIQDNHGLKREIVHRHLTKHE